MSQNTKPESVHYVRCVFIPSNFLSKMGISNLLQWQYEHAAGSFTASLLWQIKPQRPYAVSHITELWNCFPKQICSLDENKVTFRNVWPIAEVFAVNTVYTFMAVINHAQHSCSKPYLKHYVASSSHFNRNNEKLNNWYFRRRKWWPLSQWMSITLAILFIFIFIYVGVCRYIHAYTWIYLHTYKQTPWP